MRLWVRDESGNKIFFYNDKNDLEECELCLSQGIEGKCQKNRYASRRIDNSKEFIFCYESNILSKQAKFTSKMAIKGFQEAFKIAISITSDLTNLETIALHNARKLIAGIGLKSNRIASEEELALSEDKISFIEKKIKSRPYDAAREILSIRKSITQIEYEYNSIESYLKEVGKQAETGFTKHKAHTLVLMGFYLYEDDFLKKKIKLEIAPFHGSLYVDFATARSAISQILSNALKYCKPESVVKVKFAVKDGFTDLMFEMISRYFDNIEKHNFTLNKYRGLNSEGLEGQGIGLYAAQRMMMLNTGALEINSNENTRFESQGVIYSENEFLLKFKSHKQ